MSAFTSAPPGEPNSRRSPRSTRPPVPVTQSSHTVNGWLGGGQVGFNYQVDRWVWGVEAQFSWSDIDGVGLCNVIGINTCRTKIDWLGTAALRLGFTIDHALVYVKGGAAWVHDKYDTDIQGQATTFGSASETRWGWMFGTGVNTPLHAPGPRRSSTTTSTSEPRTCSTAMRALSPPAQPFVDRFPPRSVST